MKTILALTPAFLCTVAAVLSRVPEEKRGVETHVFSCQEDGSILWARVTPDAVEAAESSEHIDLSKIPGWKAGDTGALTLGRAGKPVVVNLWSKGGGYAYASQSEDGSVEGKGTDRCRDLATALVSQGLGHPIAAAILAASSGKVTAAA